MRARGAIPGENPKAAEGGGAAHLARMLRRDFGKQVRERLPFLEYATLLFTSATEGEGIADILPLCSTVADNFSRRIATGTLNRALMKAMVKHAPPSRKGRRLKIYYCTQVAASPPAIACFVNDTTLMHWSYRRYLVNFFREEFGFQGTPIRVYVRPSHDRDRETEIE